MSDPLFLWANFLENHKLDPSEGKIDLEKGHLLLQLCDLLSKTGHTPKVKPYKARLESRCLICTTAMEAGIDLTAIRRRGKIAMSRGLLDVWNQVYQERYGSNLGTAGKKESARRDIKTKLSGQ